MSVLVIAEHNNSQLNPSTLSSLSAASEINQDIVLLVAGYNCQTVADQASQIPCVQKVTVADNPAYEHALAENIAPLIADLADGHSHILATATTTAKNIMPRVAALLDVQAISDISAVLDENTFKRPIYAGNLIATVQTEDAVKVLTVRGTAFDAVAVDGGTAEVESIAIAHDKAISSFVGQQLAKIGHLLL